MILCVQYFVLYPSLCKNKSNELLKKRNESITYFLLDIQIIISIHYPDHVKEFVNFSDKEHGISCFIITTTKRSEWCPFFQMNVLRD